MSGKEIDEFGNYEIISIIFKDADNKEHLLKRNPRTLEKHF